MLGLPPNSTMIDIVMSVTEEGDHVKTVVGAKTNGASTDAETKEVDLIMGVLQKYFLDHGGEARFIDRHQV